MWQQFKAAFDAPFVHVLLRDAWISAPIWLPILLAALCFDLWLTYKRREWIKKEGNFLLEIRLPREMLKSPVAMELFLNTLYNTAVGSLLKVYLKGQVRVWYSLELVSIDGAVHFYVWSKGTKNRIEAQLYAQFPNVEIHEVPDYTLGVHRDPKVRTFGWFGQFALTKPDAYPIKTYVDYGLDKDPKEEFKNDPLVSVLEFLGSLKRGEQAWIQILIQPHTKEGLKYGRIFERPDWNKGIEKEIQEILKKGLLKPKEDKALDSTKHLSSGQRDVIAAIERTAAKPPFDTMIRVTYFADNAVYNPTNIGGIIGSIAQFGSPGLNGFKPDFKTDYDYPWQDPFGKKKAENEKNLLEAYKRRSFFNAPFKNFHGKSFVLTTEEIATLFHFPGAVAGTPTITRIPSKKAEAPTNLPI